MIRRVDQPDALAEHLHRVLFAIGDRRGELTREQRKRIGIVAWRGELLVEQLQRRLELGRGGGSRDAVRGQPDERARRGQFARQQLLQIDRLQAANPAQHDVGRRERGVRVVRGRRQRGPARCVHGEQDLIVLEVGRLQPGLDAVGEADDRHADALELASRSDGGRFGFRFHQPPRRDRVVPGRDRGAFSAAVSAARRLVSRGS